MIHDLPAFLDNGSLNWDGLGYALSAPPPLELLSPTALTDADPWIVFAAVLERAKLGHFDAMPRLLDLIVSTDDDVLWSYCADLIGDAGPRRLLESLAAPLGTRLFDADHPVHQVALCGAFRQSMRLAGVPVMLEVYLRSTDRGETNVLKVLLSQLLEAELGPIGCFTGADEDFRALVVDRCAELRATLGSSQRPVLGGALFSVESVARKLHAELTSGDPNGVTVLRLRHHLEASTGLDCSGFYKDESLQYLDATAIVEEFLKDAPGRRYMPGLRYFYGHQIPD